MAPNVEVKPQLSVFAQIARIVRKHSWTIGVALFILALIPRVFATATFLVPDEPTGWFVRSQHFLEAMRQGNFADTGPVGHPGVTTMWLGALGHLLREQFLVPQWRTPAEFEAMVHVLRLPITVANAACIGLAYSPLRRLVGAPVALLALLLWAANPLGVAITQVLHVDGLLTSLMLLALLYALVAVRLDAPVELNAAAVRWPVLLAAAVASGLALLSKSPAIMLLPMVGLIALTSMWRRQAVQPWPRRLGRAMVAATPIVLVWAAATALIWVAGWPLAWVDAPEALRRVVGEVVHNGTRPHETGNFFLGRAVADPGPLFYPVALVLRLTPWTLLGCLLGAGALARRTLPPHRRTSLLLLMASALAFLLMLTVMAKKMDRYALPIFPMLDLLAAQGYVTLATWLAQWLRRPSRPAVALTGTALAVVAAGNLAWYHPYELTYYNQLLGGGPVAQASISVGWGEGFDLAAAFIMRQPDACKRPVAVWLPPMLGPYTCRNVLRLNAVNEAFDQLGYAMLYRDVIQRGMQPDVVQKLLALEPIYTVRIHGVELASVYQFPLPMGQVITADFGDSVRLYSYALDATRRGDQSVLTLRTQWQAHGPIGADYILFIHVFDAGGKLLTQIDVPPAGPEVLTSGWQAGRYVQGSQPLALPAGLPAGRYWVALGLYDPQTGLRLTLTAGAAPPGAPTDGPDALLLGPVEVQ